MIKHMSTHTNKLPEYSTKALARNYGPDAVACGDRLNQTVSHRVKWLKKHYIACVYFCASAVLRACVCSLPSSCASVCACLFTCLYPSPCGSQAGRVHPTQQATFTEQSDANNLCLKEAFFLLSKANCSNWAESNKKESCCTSRCDSRSETHFT